MGAFFGPAGIAVQMTCNRYVTDIIFSSHTRIFILHYLHL